LKPLGEGQAALTNLPLCPGAVACPSPKCHGVGAFLRYILSVMSCKIKLTTGEVALVSKKDLSDISKHNWYHLRVGKEGYEKRVYAQSHIDGTPVQMHRFILDFPDGEVDHINGDGLDNRRKNLRVCSRSQNLCNKGSYEGSSSQYKGVHYRSGRDHFEAELYYEGERYWLGVFDSEREAALAYDRKALEIHGEFARLNILKQPELFET